MNNALEALRQQIDSIDAKIINLLSERMMIVHEVGKYKKQNGIAPLDEKRWQQVLGTRLTLARKLGLDTEMVENIYEQIHMSALKIESKVSEEIQK